MQRVVEIGESILRTIADNMLDALTRSGFKPTDLSANRREPFLLSEEETIAEGLRRMTDEEVYYRYSKCTTKATADRAQKALRVLLSED